jgi:hypothetical protein
MRYEIAGLDEKKRGEKKGKSRLIKYQAWRKKRQSTLVCA